ncbi:MAG: hypothetical protein C3F06_14715 [Candidatus Methanoperedenaceae archaeon]|nr:MAG: hypothetical protein C3F06_14715 [Candidatus Methanoperedenaceae archaeon]
MSNQIYPRIRASFIVFLFFILVLVFIFISLNIFGTAFRRLGFAPEYSVYFLFLSLPCSYLNIPIKKIRSHEPVISDKASDVLRSGLYASSPKMYSAIAVNIGGAVIPMIMSLFLLSKAKPINVLVGILVMTIIIHKIARPVKGSGIAIHALLPPFLAAFVAIIISPQNAPVIAYISGTIGCILGIDILNLNKIHYLGVPLVSIGGAGTFDAIFLTGIISVLLA